MTDKNKLIYDLIFSKFNKFEINIAEYIKDIYQYDIFIDDIRDILWKSKVMIIEDKIIVNPDIIWELKVKK